MPRFIIEVEHEGTKQACLRAIRLFHETGSHFLTHADWGCMDGEHKAWITVEMNSKEEARSIVPAQYRAQAKVVQLTAFTRQDLDNLLQQHG